MELGKCLGHMFSAPVTEWGGIERVLSELEYYIGLPLYTGYEIRTLISERGMDNMMLSITFEMLDF